MTTSGSGSTLPLRAAVVGSGGISKEHLTYLSGRAPSAGPVAGRVRLVSVCDLSPVSARYGAEQFGADRWDTDVATMIAETRPDVVHVLTPPASHVPLVTQCLDAGCHVICEKPITPTAPELDGLLAAAGAADRHLVESHNYRFNREIVDIREAVDAGRLGAVREVEIRVVLPVTDPAGRFGDPNLPSPIHDLPAGVVHDFTTHFGYLLYHLAGPVEFGRVAAAWSNHEANPLFRYDDLDAVLVGEGPNGPVHGRLRFDAASAPDTFLVRVRGTEGWMETDLFQPYERLVVARPGGAQLSPIVNHVVNGVTLAGSGLRNVGRKLLQHSPYEGLHRMLDLTYAALASGGEPPITPDDMVRASRLVDALLAEENRL